MKRTKEFLIKGCHTDKDALAKLAGEIADYVKDKGKWHFLKKPEVQMHLGIDEWWAYARIEFE